jgi:phage shock protein C
MTERLYRSRDDRMLAGVAGGLAELWDADPSLVRIVWALLVIFTGGLAFVLYIIMAIVVPEEPEGAQRAPSSDAEGAQPAPSSDAEAGWPGAGASPAAAPAPAPSSDGWVSPPANAREARRQARAARRAARRDRDGVPLGILGGLLLVAIGGFFLARQWLPEIDFDWFWPLVLVGLGILLIVTAVTRRPDEPGGPT